AGDVIDDDRLGVVEGLHLEQGVAAADLVARAGLAQHEPLAAEALDPRQLCAQVIEAAAWLVRMRLCVPRRAHGVAAPREPLLEEAAVRGRVEDHEAQLLPRVSAVLPLHDADGALEALAAAEELAVERRLGQAVGEPRGRDEGLPSRET